MTFELVTKSVKAVVDTISNAATASVVALKSHTFDVNVSNPTKKMVVSGTVVVGNQKYLESLVKDLGKTEKNFFDAEAKRVVKVQEITPVKSLKVDNLKEIDFSGVVAGLNEVRKLLTKLPTVYPTEVNVKNNPVDELALIKRTLDDVVSGIKGIKLDPKISVLPTPVTVTPPVAPVVNIKETKIDYAEFGKQMLEALYDQKPSKHINARLTDGKKFYEAMKEMVTITSGGGGNYSFRNMTGERGYGRIDTSGALQTGEMPYSKRVITDGLIIYVAQAVPGTDYTDTGWQCMKEDGTNKLDIKITWAGAGLFNQKADNLPSLTYE